MGIPRFGGRRQRHNRWLCGFEFFLQISTKSSPCFCLSWHFRWGHRHHQHHHHQCHCCRPFQPCFSFLPKKKMLSGQDGRLSLSTQDHNYHFPPWLSPFTTTIVIQRVRQEDYASEVTNAIVKPDMGSSVPGVGNLSYMAGQTTTMAIGERSPTATMVAQTTMSTLIPCVCNMCGKSS